MALPKHYPSLLRPVPWALGLAMVLAIVRREHVSAEPSARAAVAQAFARRGLLCSPDDVVWLNAPQRQGGLIDERAARAIVRAGVSGEPTDLFVADLRFSPEGRVLRVSDTWNITRTSGVDESRPEVLGALVAYTTAADGLFTAIHVLDLSGREVPDDFDVEGHPVLSPIERAQVALTNWQQTGQMQGLWHGVLVLDPVARSALISIREDGRIEARADGHLVVFDPKSARVLDGPSYVRFISDTRTRPPSLVPWAVDRVRAVSWFGDDRMQWLKAVAFTAFDALATLVSHGTTADEVRIELGVSSQPAPLAAVPVDPEVGWPPPPMQLPVKPGLPGEGQWMPVSGDPFITPLPNGDAPAFVTSFVRPDAERKDARVYVTMWDPRQIALHMEAGTVEPTSVTGERGLGMIPRAPEVMRHVVAAFNGGFQAQHGEYGMRADGVDYLPPKPYAASVLELRDGSNGFGAWPSAAVVPDDVLSLRQNLTALVQDGRLNPWGRTWWGGTPPGWPDQVHTTRSGLCLTRAGFAAYFYSTSISADDLGRGMLAANCSFGLHLDMNPGHAGFEFYDVAPTGELAPLGRRLSPDWEAEGRVPEAPGAIFRSRRMIRAMGHMLFPRYIQREARDFFYLTTRSILPGAPLSMPASEARTFRTGGLPQHGFPYATAIASAPLDSEAAGPATAPQDGSAVLSGRSEGLRLRVVRADPRMMTSIDRAPAGAPTVLAFSGGGRGSQALLWTPGGFAIAPTALALTREARIIVQGELLGKPSTAPASGPVRAAAGVQDEDGMLLWVELPPEAIANARTDAAMDDLLTSAGCSMRLGASSGARAFPGGTLDAAGFYEADPPVLAARLVRAEAPNAHRVFVDTPLVPTSIWQPLQAKRVRYLAKPAASGASSMPESSNASTSSPASTADRRSRPAPSDMLAHDPDGR